MYKKFSSNQFESGSQNFGRARTENRNRQPNLEPRTEQDRTFGPVRRFSVHWISSELNFGNPSDKHLELQDMFFNQVIS